MSKALNEKPNAEPLPVAASAGVMLNGRYLPPPEDKDGKIWVRTSALVHADAQELYNMWRDVETAPLWQEQIEKVTRTGETTSHWVMQSGGKDKDTDNNEVKSKTIEWDSEILKDEPGHRIAWRSIGGESDNAGEVDFRSFSGRPGNNGHGSARVSNGQVGQRVGNHHRPESEAGCHRKSPPFQSPRRDG